MRFDKHFKTILTSVHSQTHNQHILVYEAHTHKSALCILIVHILAEGMDGMQNCIESLTIFMHNANIILKVVCIINASKIFRWRKSLVLMLILYQTNYMLVYPLLHHPAARLLILCMHLYCSAQYNMRHTCYAPHIYAFPHELYCAWCTAGKYYRMHTKYGIG